MDCDGDGKSLLPVAVFAMVGVSGQVSGINTITEVLLSGTEVSGIRIVLSALRVCCVLCCHKLNASERLP